MLVFFFKQKTAYDMRISDWSSDVCSSDLEYIGLAIGVSDLLSAQPAGKIHLGANAIFISDATESVCIAIPADCRLKGESALCKKRQCAQQYIHALQRNQSAHEADFWYFMARECRFLGRRHSISDCDHFIREHAGFARYECA